MVQGDPCCRPAQNSSNCGLKEWYKATPVVDQHKTPAIVVLKSGGTWSDVHCNTSHHSLTGDWWLMTFGGWGVAGGERLEQKEKKVRGFKIVCVYMCVDVGENKW